MGFLASFNLGGTSGRRIDAVGAEYGIHPRRVARQLAFAPPIDGKPQPAPVFESAVRM
jgi:hypothetical protein